MPRAAGPEDVAGTELDAGAVEKPAGRPGEVGHHRETLADLLGAAELPAIHCAMTLGEAEGHGAGQAAIAATAMRVVNAIPVSSTRPLAW